MCSYCFCEFLLRSSKFHTKTVNVIPSFPKDLCMKSEELSQRGGMSPVQKEKFLIFVCDDCEADFCNVRQRIKQVSELQNKFDTLVESVFEKIDFSNLLCHS